MATPTPFGGTPMYSIPEENRSQTYDVPQQIEGLPDMKPEDQQYFGALLKVRNGNRRAGYCMCQPCGRAEPHTASPPCAALMHCCTA